MKARTLLSVSALLFLTACSSIRPTHPQDAIDRAAFQRLLETVAQGWNANNAKMAADCFSEDALYSSPPNPRIRRGRAALFEFFGGDKGRPKPMSIEWHHIVFDPTTQIGMGEYTFTYEIRTHGVVVIRIQHGKISNWREYEHESPLDWDKLAGENLF